MVACSMQELQALGDAVGTVPRGVPQALIDALPLARFSAPVAAAAAAAPLHAPGSRALPGLGLGPAASAAAAAAVEEEQCAVCRMEFEGGEDVRLLPCAHVYHPPCIEQWLLLNKARGLPSRDGMLAGWLRTWSCGGGQGHARTALRACDHLFCVERCSAWRTPTHEGVCLTVAIVVFSGACVQ